MLASSEVIIVGFTASNFFGVFLACVFEYPVTGVSVPLGALHARIDSEEFEEMFWVCLCLFLDIPEAHRAAIASDLRESFDEAAFVVIGVVDILLKENTDKIHIDDAVFQDAVVNAVSEVVENPEVFRKKISQSRKVVQGEVVRMSAQN